MEIKFSRDKVIKLEQLEKLYNDVEWFAYTKDLYFIKQSISPWKLFLLGMVKNWLG
ncbi:hypothetical protein [Bacillus sp. LL01]|uniref:hypothetical protein n=1 Tax=Bacillus sp. LL01 TaxID=1665556 RepID=UPI001F51B77C|nr:hypothetical protein [Bacillus sp. LL01]